MFLILWDLPTTFVLELIMKRNVFVIVLLVGFVFSAFSQNISDFGYQVRDRRITITGYRGSSTTVIIPATIYGWSVVAIGDDAFNSKRLTSVTIPNSVTTIGSQAFFQNPLTSVIIPNSVTTIGGHAFAGDNRQLTSVVIPNSVINFDSTVFNNSVEIRRP